MAINRGCHVNYNCYRFIKRGGKCPSLGSLDPKDISNKNKILKSNFLKSPLISWIALSSWMLNQAQSAKINNENITLLPNVINNSIFKYSDSNPRKEVNSNFIILVGAANLRENIKDLNL